VDVVFNPFAIENTIMLALALVLFVVKAFAFLDALGRPQQVFPAADRQTKKFWLLILGLFLLEHLIFWQVIGLLSLIGTVAALVYVLDVRPTVRALTSR
jgi:Protein of unknown function (DUF2516)